MFTAQDVMDVLHQRWLDLTLARLQEEQLKIIYGAAAMGVSGGGYLRVQNPHWRNHHKSLH